MKYGTKLIVSLARARKTFIKDTQYYNVIASLVQYPYEIDLSDLKKTSDYLRTHTEFYFKTKFLVIDFTFWSPNLGEPEEICINTENLKYVKYNIFYFIKMLIDGPNNNPLSIFLKEAFNAQLNIDESKIKLGSLENLFLNENMQYNNIIFIFNDLKWSNILILFRLLKINIYGGHNSKRHLLSTVQSSLVKFLLLLNELKLSPDIIYHSFNNLGSVHSKYDKDCGSAAETRKNNTKGGSATISESLLFLYSYEPVSNCIIFITDKILEVKKLKLSIQKDLTNLKDIELRIKKYKLNEIGYSDKFTAKKLEVAQQKLPVVKEAIKKQISDLKNEEDLIKKNILNLYNHERDLFFSKEGIFLYDNNIFIINEKNENYYLSDSNKVIFKKSYLEGILDNNITNNKQISNV